MGDSSLNKEILMDHYRSPRNRAALGDADVVRRGSNPRCGDELEIGVNFDGGMLQQVRFRGRGCSVCIASASMMTEAVTGQRREEAHRLYERMKAWFSADDVGARAPLESLQPLAAVRGQSARRRCVLLAWEALNDALGAD